MDLVKAQGPDMVKWTDAAEGAFTDLQTALCNDPVLIAPDFNREFILQTGASEVGLGAVLSQMVGEEKHLILYLSRELLPREQKYAVVERECLAVKWAMETLCYYLLGQRFTLVTDHAYGYGTGLDATMATLTVCHEPGIPSCRTLWC
ncbi:unnamed protein product [Caretta caretta]